MLHQLWHLHDSLPPSSAFIYRPDDPDLPLKALLAMLAEHHRPPWATGLSARKTVRRLHHNSSDPNKLQGLCLSIAQELVSKRVTDIQSLNPDKASCSLQKSFGMHIFLPAVLQFLPACKSTVHACCPALSRGDSLLDAMSRSAGSMLTLTNILGATDTQAPCHTPTRTDTLATTHLKPISISEAM